jgi:hypothetical protein
MRFLNRRYEFLMRNLGELQTFKRILIVALVSIIFGGAKVNSQVEKDPHRPPCVSEHCRRIRSYLKLHYCGKSPFGNGPDDGCEIKIPVRPRIGTNVIADFRCVWSESKQRMQCEQHGQPSPVVRNALMRELQRLGLPAKANGETYFTVWDSSTAAWSIGKAAYSRRVGPDIELCQVILIIDQSSHVVVLRELPFVRTAVDVPEVTSWSPIDLADINGNGQVDVILRGDAYEDHWLEAVSVEHGSARTVFSGLGYYL